MIDQSIDGLIDWLIFWLRLYLMFLAAQLFSETQWLFAEFNDFSVLLQLIHRHEIEVLHNLKTKSHKSVTDTHGLHHIHSFWLIRQAILPNEYMSCDPNKYKTIGRAVFTSRHVPLILYFRKRTIFLFFSRPYVTITDWRCHPSAIHYLAFSLGH